MNYYDLSLGQSKSIREKITRLKTRWRSDPRLHILHSHDILIINQKFEIIENVTKFNENNKLLIKHFEELKYLILKSDERMSFMSLILLDLINQD
jgi:hypothetical protein